MSGGGISAPNKATVPQVQPSSTPLITAQQQLLQPTQPLIMTQGLGNNTLDASNFDSTGLYGHWNPANNSYNIYENPATANAMAGLFNTFQTGAQRFGDLAATVQPGFSLFRQQGLLDLEQQRQANQSNLQANLAQRRVLGSSFGNSAISNANADFAKKRDDFIAQSYLQELSASSMLTQQQYTMAAQGYQAQLQQYNLESGLAAELSSKMHTTLASIAETQGQLDLSAAQTNAQGAMLQSQLDLQTQEFNIQTALQAQEFNAQMQMAEMMGIGQMAGGLLGSFGGGGKSDQRVKRDIKRIGTWVNGLPVYLFRYIFSNRWFVGFMAQDVEKVIPEAVYEIGGIKHVNYGLAIDG